MNRRRLADALIAAGLPAGAFQIAGVHESDPLPTDFWFLRPGNAADWEVGAYERGSYDVRERFPTEADAARWMYTTMVGHPPPP